MISQRPHSFVLILLAIALITNAWAQQLTLSFGTKFDSYDAELFAPLEDLSLLSTTEFTTLGHPAFPKYDVRIKKSNFCDGTVR